MPLIRYFISCLIITIGMMPPAIGQNMPSDSLEKETNIVSHTKKMERYRTDPSFGYMGHLDSLLRVKQQLSRPVPKPSRKIKQPPGDSGFREFLESGITRIFFWILASVFIGIILYRLLFHIRFPRNRNISYNTIDPDNSQELKTADAYKVPIDGAEEKGDYTVAVRLLYLSALSSLQEREWLQFEPAKTNADYISEIENKAIKMEFAHLTSFYERVWFGKKAPSAQEYPALKGSFEQFNTML